MYSQFSFMPWTPRLVSGTDESTSRNCGKNGREKVIRMSCVLLRLGNALEFCEAPRAASELSSA